MAACFAAVPDPRDRRGIRYSLPCILTLVTAALLSGKTTLEEVTAWVSHADARLLAALGAHRDRHGNLSAPHRKTVAAVLGLVGAAALAGASARFLAARLPPAGAGGLLPQVACDGKAVRGAVRPDGSCPFLLSAARDGTVIAEREIGAKTSEITGIGPMLTSLNAYYPLAGHVITADALHAQRALAALVCGDLRAHYVLTVKDNQKHLRAALAGLDWPRARRHLAAGRAHGRTEERTCLVLPLPPHLRAMFPHAARAARITRTVTRTTRSRPGRTPQATTATETAYIITSLPARHAAPDRIAAYARGHWAIENKVHWVRDAVYREDASRVRAAARPLVLATLRNLALGLLRTRGYTSIAPTLRAIEYDIPLLMDILGLPQTP